MRQTSYIHSYLWTRYDLSAATLDESDLEISRMSEILKISRISKKSLELDMAKLIMIINYGNTYK